MINTAITYLKETIDENVTVEKWNESEKLSLYLRTYFNYYSMSILDEKCLLIEFKNDSSSLNQLQKQIQQLKSYTMWPIVCYYSSLTTHRRKTLIENRIPFISHDGQLFLPFLGLLLKQSQDENRINKRRFSSSAQLAFLYLLYKKETVNVTQLAQELDVSMMTASRALNELYSAQLLTYEIKGKTARSKVYKRIKHPHYFKQAQTYLNTPVRKVVYTKDRPLNGYLAGLSALSSISEVNDSKNLTYAMYYQDLSINQLELVENEDVIKDESLIEVQLWSYDPKKVAQSGRVDLLSLYLSLSENNEERVKHALEDALLGEAWYMD